MENLNNIDLFTLVDLLAKYTNDYMKMFKNGTTDEDYVRCKNMIHNLTAEIEYRRQKTLNAKKPRTAQNGNSK